ncbi:hypothetical protein NVV94_12610 [Pseudomonas sp. LS1212]|uniref:hypothetical protein n=1 Tax=Pseudomonas sp. LS1212 TaxID=2972478 RepID=UPI00215CA370|nr:hypothetical protein [Pseudomonas sp. LS1212]UVJ46296.1 hypothetical protein NVV94_12610 [Pseudomonas sp. LS1212]
MKKWRTSLKSKDPQVVEHARIEHAIYKGELVDYLDEAIENALKNSPQRSDE